jgi:hypothetical protein
MEEVKLPNILAIGIMLLIALGLILWLGAHVTDENRNKTTQLQMYCIDHSGVWIQQDAICIPANQGGSR